MTNTPDPLQPVPPIKQDIDRAIKGLLAIEVLIVLETEDELVDVSDTIDINGSEEVSGKKPEQVMMRSYTVRAVMKRQQSGGVVVAVGKLVRIPQDKGALPYPVFHILTDEKNGFSLTLEAGSL